MNLSIDQRWLLLHMGGWEIVGALCSPEAVKKLMQSCWGSSGGRSHASDLPDAPAWLKKCGWETSGGVITAKNHGNPNVKIKAADINRFAATIPDDIKAELLECRNAGTANAVLRYRHCYCGDSKRKHFEKDVICPPTDEQERDCTNEYWRVIDWQKRVLVKALGLGESQVTEDQLELFEVSA